MSEPTADAHLRESGLQTQINDEPLMPPTSSRFEGPAPSLNDTSTHTSFVGSPVTEQDRPMLVATDEPLEYNEKAPGSPHRRWKRWPILALVAVVAAIIIALVIALPVALVHRGSHNTNGGDGSHDSSPSSPAPNPESPTGAVSGGNGSQITTEDGATFTYVNNLGGFWIDDPKNPFNNSARAQSYTPSLDEPWVWGQDLIRGVNLGGWLVTEPFIVPALYEKYQNTTPQAIDEWTLSVAMRSDTSEGGGIGQLEEHYKTFITEHDFAEIAGAGLNWVRLPIPYWAIEVWPGEPFLANTAWTYSLKALKWARKYGLRVLLELHTVPGSQNGLNHSGRLGTINFLNGPMGVANAQRAMEYIRVITEFISQPEYEPVVQAFGMINEPLMGIIGRDPLNSFYLEVYNMIRNITRIGKGPSLVIHDGFQGLGTWKGFMIGADRLVLDTHPYVAFGGGLDQPLDHWPPAACQAFQTNQSNIDFGPTITGEFSAAVNDCGKWLKNVGAEASFSDCTVWDDYRQWTQDMKNGIKQFVMGSMDAMHMPGYMFWTWKIGTSSVTGVPSAPMWSYQLGLENGWMPLDPREAEGTCTTLNVAFGVNFTGQFPAWQTGGADAGVFQPSATSTIEVYPPTLSNAMDANPTLLPFYTDVSANPTLPATTFMGATVSVGNGWVESQDTALAPAPVPGCIYPDAWGAPQDSTAFLCGATATTATATTSP